MQENRDVGLYVLSECLWPNSCSVLRVVRVCRQQLIKPMGVRKDGTLAPLEETVRACRDNSSDSDSD